MTNSVIAIICAYLIGSLSFAVIVSAAMGLPDPHSYGSGNPGATNVLRTGKKLEWNGPKMRAKNAPEAAQYVKRINRKGWSL